MGQHRVHVHTRFKVGFYPRDTRVGAQPRSDWLFTLRDAPPARAKARADFVLALEARGGRGATPEGEAQGARGAVVGRAEGTRRVD